MRYLSPVPRVVLLAGPSGSGKSRLSTESGYPVVNLDDFYLDGDHPDMPRHPDLGIIDWDDPRAWDAQRASEALDELCRTGSAEVPVYDIGMDRATGSHRIEAANSPVVVAEGLFAGEIITACRERGILADALVVRRPAWMNFVRRMIRDLAEHRKPPLTLLRRGLALMRAEAGIVRRQVELGARAVDADGVRAAIRDAAEAPSGMP